jgi:hypothetical protein
MNRRSFLKVGFLALFTPILSQFKPKKTEWTHIPLKFPKDGERDVHLYIEKFDPHRMEISHSGVDYGLHSDMTVILLDDMEPDELVIIQPQTDQEIIHYTWGRKDGFDYWCSSGPNDRERIRQLIENSHCPIEIQVGHIAPCGCFVPDEKVEDI